VPPQAQPQPGAGWAAPVGFGPPVPPRKSRKGLYITLAVVVGAIGVAVAVLVSTVADVVAKEGTQKVVLPQSFQGLTADDGNSTAQKLKGTLSTDSTLDGTVATVYAAPGAGRGVVAWGGYGRIASPKAEENTFWSHFESRAGYTFGPRSHPDPGPKGGTMSCEDETNSGGTYAVCLWADNSSLMVMLQTNSDGTAPSLDKAASDLRDLRAVAEVPK
jgi:hypothetical protein